MALEHKKLTQKVIFLAIWFTLIAFNQESEVSGEETIETHSTHQKDQASHEEKMETHGSEKESEETGKETIQTQNSQKKRQKWWKFVTGEKHV